MEINGKVVRQVEVTFYGEHGEHLERLHIPVEEKQGIIFLNETYIKTLQKDRARQNVISYKKLLEKEEQLLKEIEK